MSRRIDVELTSDRGDGNWTWRAAGAKQPKGEVDATLLPDGASTGDVLTAEADFDIDGITILSVAAPKRAKRSEPELLEILGSGKEQAAVTTTWVERKGGGKKGRGGGRGRDGDDRGNRGGGRGRGGDDRGNRGGGRERSHSPAPPERPKKPKAPRLRPKRTHRDAAMAALTEAERPVAEQALKGGIPAVRDALRAQNEENQKAGRPTVAADAVVGLAEQLLPALKTAEWHDRAEAAIAQMEKVDLRDLRSVVTASDGAARDDTTRALAEQVKSGLAARVESDHGAWLAELAETLADGRVARALNLSSRPPKAGAPLPVDMAERLAAAASAGLTAEVGQKRWQTVLESVARSPVRQSVVPEGVPANPNDELLEMVRNVSMQVPQIAAAFGIEPQRPSRKRRSRKGSGGGAPGAAKPTAPAATERKAAPRIPPPPTLPTKADEATAPEAATTEPADGPDGSTAEPQPDATDRGAPAPSEDAAEPAEAAASTPEATEATEVPEAADATAATDAEAAAPTGAADAGEAEAAEVAEVAETAGDDVEPDDDGADSASDDEE